MRNVRPIIVLASVATLWACQDETDMGESRDFVVSVANLTPPQSLFSSGNFDTPDDALVPGPIGPGQSYRFDVVVDPGSQLQIITMFVESNDAFLAFKPGGIALWSPSGEPQTGDRSKNLVLYDAGTEHNEALGMGEYQAPRQGEPGAGVDESGRITAISDGESSAAVGPDDVEFPAISDFAEVHVEHRGGSSFRVVIRNVSPKQLLANPPVGSSKDAKPALLSPGVFTVQDVGVQQFRVGERASPALERLAEDGDPEPLAAVFDYRGGVASDLSNVVWAVHQGDAPLYTTGSAASAGLEDLAEDGRPEVLLNELARREDIVAYGLAAGEDGGPVIVPGDAIELRFRAAPGDRLSLVTGDLSTNDKFIGSGPLGIPLFGDDDEPRFGELDWALELLDAGTEVDEAPGLGPSQFERQSRAGAGIDEGEVVREVHGAWKGWVYRPADELVQVRVDVVNEVRPNGDP